MAMDMNKMMKQARKMQADLARAQEEVAAMTAEGSAGGGVVSAVALGDGTIQKVSINPAVIDPEDTEMLEDLVTAAVNDALRAVQELASAKMSAITGGLDNLGIPGF